MLSRAELHLTAKSSLTDLRDARMSVMPISDQRALVPASTRISMPAMTPALMMSLVLLVCVYAASHVHAASIDDLPSAAERANLPADGGDEYNRLIHSASPYLLQHARNPVQWYEWGDEAFEQAARENKPIFLSIGYSTCHWCHVMGRESFADAQVAEVLNRDFIAIKLDREERPDVDHVYMTFVQATTGHGGWPMSVWLTPDRQPIVGGTYFPKGHFLQALGRIAHLWEQDPLALQARAEHIAGELAHMTAGTPADGDLPGQEILDAAVRDLVSQYDEADGGFGAAPKFPRPVAFEFLFATHARGGEHAEQALSMSLTTLREMARGGMYDHVGGGFHRYSVDGEWHVPHFEKMLYDQGQLLASYADALQIIDAEHPDRADFTRVIHETVAYLLRDMRHPEGGLYSAEDADSQRADGGIGEGVFYVWSDAELREVLDSTAYAAVAAAWGVQANGNVEPASDPHHEFTGVNVLTRRLADEDVAVNQADLARAREVLFAERESRQRPHLDDKILAAWNGLAISGLAHAAEVLDHAEALQLASDAAGFLRQHMYDTETKTLFRSWRDGQHSGPGFAVDYAFVIQGLLDLHRVSGDIAHVQWAAELQQKWIVALVIRTPAAGSIMMAAMIRCCCGPKNSTTGPSLQRHLLQCAMHCVWPNSRTTMHCVSRHALLWMVPPKRSGNRRVQLRHYLLV